MNKVYPEFLEIHDEIYPKQDFMRYTPSMPKTDENVVFPYGERLSSGVEKIINSMELTNRDTFCDLGCGAGSMVMQVFIQTSVHKSVGIEVDPNRYEIAKNSLSIFNNKYGVDSNRSIVFKKGSFFDENFNDYTVVFIGCTMFNNDFWSKIEDKIAGSNNVRMVVSAREIDVNSMCYSRCIGVETSWDFVPEKIRIYTRAV